MRALRLVESEGQLGLRMVMETHRMERLEKVVTEQFVLRIPEHGEGAGASDVVGDVVVT